MLSELPLAPKNVNAEEVVKMPTRPDSCRLVVVITLLYAIKSQREHMSPVRDNHSRAVVCIYILTRPIILQSTCIMFVVSIAMPDLDRCMKDLPRLPLVHQKSRCCRVMQ